jgi:serine/threonine-protein kinase
MSNQGNGLTPDHWRRVKEVFSAALERSRADRAAFLDEVCGAADADIRREVEALLAAHQESDSFLQTPAAIAPPSPSHRVLAEGQSLGAYRVLRPLGHGGMATVYLARDLRHRRSVALKVLHPELGRVLGAHRFLREIEVAANLSHPHILPLHDSGQTEGLLYYVMPYVDGESLRDRLNRETQLAVNESLQIAREVADALAYAHGQGVIHRDIKPENILLSGGHALVADFGIAQVLGQAGVDRLTGTGMAVGTVAYMSPEQASGTQRIDGRSDIYSLGCVLYEMLAGEPPFTGPTPQAILVRRMSESPPSVRQMRATVPPGIEYAIARSIAPVPADRFSTMAELQDALRPTGASGGTVGQSTERTLWLTRRRLLSLARGRPFKIALAVLVLLVAFALGIQVYRHSAAAAVGAAEKVVAVLPFENLGDSADAYFADGVGDEIRGKLAQVEGLAVIARASSNEYRHTGKPLRQIARELGANYLLTATVRWDKHPDGTSKVRVIPELVSVASGAAPTTKWQQGFDAALTDVFQVQADIASQVAHALDVALGDSVERQLAVKPTQSLPAYDAFLRGEATQGLTTLDPALLRRAIADYEEAVVLDSTFSKAWAQLSRAHSYLYPSGAATPTTRRKRPSGPRSVRWRSLPWSSKVIRPWGPTTATLWRISRAPTPKTAPHSPSRPETPIFSGPWASTSMACSAGRRRAGT